MHVLLFFLLRLSKFIYTYLDIILKMTDVTGLVNDGCDGSGQWVRFRKCFFMPLFYFFILIETFYFTVENLKSNGVAMLSGCPSMYHGANCLDHCNCSTDGSEACNRFTGHCICRPGFHGNRCQHGK